LEAQQLSSSVQAGAIRGRPTRKREREKKIIIEVYGEGKQMLEFKAAPNKKKYR